MLSRLLSIPAAAFDATACSLKVSADLLQRAAAALQPADDTLEPADHREAAPTTGIEPATADVPAAGASRATAPAEPAEAADLTAVADAAPGWADLSDGTESAARPASSPEKAAEPRPRSSTFSPERLTAAPVKTVIRALDGLSSSELSALYEHEAANRNRKTLLRAIEQAVLPPDPLVDRRTPLAAAEDEARTDVGDVAVEQPSETVYSTES